jgi:hypothetical protein
MGVVIVDELERFSAQKRELRELNSAPFCRIKEKMGTDAV